MCDNFGFVFLFSPTKKLEFNSIGIFILESTMEGNSIPVGTGVWQNHCNGNTTYPITMQANDMEPVANRKKTWSELKESVTELRKQLSRLATIVPMNIQFRKLSDSRIRIYFLGTPPNGWVSLNWAIHFKIFTFTHCYFFFHFSRSNPS